MKRYKVAIASTLCSTLLIVLAPQKTQAQAVIGIPVVETIIIGGIVYYVWLNSQGEEQQSATYPMLEDPEDELQWGVYPANDNEQCHYKAAGRDWRWIDGECHIKG